MSNSFSDYGFGIYNRSGNNVWESIKMIANDVLHRASPDPEVRERAEKSMHWEAQYGEDPLSRAGIEAGKSFVKLLQKR